VERIIRLTRFLLCLLATTVLLGCGVGGDDPNSLRLVWFGGEEEERAVRESVAAFEEAHPGRRVTVQMVEWTRYNEKVMTMLLGERPPDVARMSVQWCSRYHAIGALADISAMVSPEALADFDPGRLASCRAEGDLFGLPHTTVGLLVFTNHDLFAEAGIEPPRTPEEAWTWDELSETAQVLQRETGVRHGWGLFRGWFPILPFFYQNGGHLMQSGEPDFANPANVEALAWLVDQHDRGIAPASSWTQGGDSAETLFIRGDSAMVMTGNWRLRAFARQIEDFEWGVAPLPRRDRRATNSGGENLAVFNTPRAEAAAELAVFLTRPDQMRTFCEATLFLPTRRSLLEEGIDAGVHSEALALFAAQSLDFELEWASEQSTEAFAAIDHALVRQLELAMLGLLSAEESLEALNREYQEAEFE
jgi:multiple sugar transport system substrate-binding protein